MAPRLVWPTKEKPSSETRTMTAAESIRSATRDGFAFFQSNRILAEHVPASEFHRTLKIASGSQGVPPVHQIIGIKASPRINPYR